MALSKNPYKGTRDLFPQLKREQDYLFNVMRKTAALFGFEPYDGPLLEEVELYKAKSGEELINEQIYAFNDRGERFVAIRPEMTPTLARMVAQIHREYPKPLRWFSIPNLMRYERPQKGRLREHWQLNCDIFGAPEGQGEIEILQVAVMLMKQFGADARNFEINYNDRRIVDCVFKQLMGLDEAKTYKLYKIVDRYKKVDDQAREKMLSELDISLEARKIFDSYITTESGPAMGAFLNSHKQNEIAQALSNFINQAQDLGLNEYLVYDPTIVRGLDYYTGLVFEIFDKHPDNRRAICGGGAYANLLKIFNEDPLPGVGFGLGDVTLADFLRTHNLMPDFSNEKLDIMLSFQVPEAQNTVLRLAQELRMHGLKVVTQLEPVKLKKLFPLAEKKGIPFVGIMGEDELKSELIQIKNLETKDQQGFKVEKNNIKTTVTSIIDYCKKKAAP